MPQPLADKADVLKNAGCCHLETKNVLLALSSINGDIYETKVSLYLKIPAF
jgi:hypothetical protein